jgi:uncharacterized membrane protein YfcA
VLLAGQAREELRRRPSTGMILHYWFLLPVGIVIAVLAMSVGVSGAAFWVPVYLLWLRMDPLTAFWLGLFSMLFGFGSGVIRNWRDGTYDARTVRSYSLASAPGAVAGAIAQPLLGGKTLVAVFGSFLLVYGAWLAIREFLSLRASRRRDSIAWSVALLEGALTGVISIGTGILTMPILLSDSSIRTPAAIGSGVMIIFVTSLIATIARLNPPLLAALTSDLPRLAAIMLWVAPAVIIGGQLGPRIAGAIPSERHASIYLGLTLAMVALLTLMRAFS